MVLNEEGSLFQEKVTYYNMLKCHTVGVSKLRYESVYKSTYRQERNGPSLLVFLQVVCSGI